MNTPVVIGGRRIGRLRGSWLLFKESWRFLAADKEMVLIPFIMGMVNLVLFGVLVIGYYVVGGFGSFASAEEGEAALTIADYSFIFGGYVLAAFTLALSQAAITHTVYTRAHGGNATLGDSLSRAISHAGSLFGWALITSTVGIVLRVISDRSEILGKIVAAIFGAAWGVLTFFVVPSIVLGKQSFVGAIGHSATLFKRTWGELLVSNLSLGLTFMLAHVVVIVGFVGVLFFGAHTGSLSIMVVAFLLLVVWLVGASLVLSSLQGVLKTLLYIYAAEGTVPANFNRELLEGMLAQSGAVPPVPPPPAPTSVAS